MNTFQYIAVDSDGSEVKGTLEGISKEDVAGKLSRQKLMVTSIRKVWAPSFTKTLQGSKVKQSDILLFSRQLATLIKARLPLPECLEVLLNQITNPVLLDVIKKVKEDIISGTPLSVSLGRHPKLFSSLYVGMVKAGEASGKLDVILVRTAKYLDSVARLKSKIKQALIYPCLIIGVGVAVLTFITIVVIPQFQKMYASFKGELPFITKMLIKISSTTGYCIKTFPVNIILFASIFGGIFLFKKFFDTPKGKEQYDNFVLKIPVLGIYIQKVIFARFSKTLGILVNNGVPILESLDLAAGSVGSVPVSQTILQAKEKIREGEKIAETLRKYAIFPALVVQMINVGEQTGKLGETLEQIAEFYDEEVEIATSTFISMIEPVLIIILAGLVAVMVLGLYLPIFKMYQGMNNKY